MYIISDVVSMYYYDQLSFNNATNVYYANVYEIILLGIIIVGFSPFPISSYRARGRAPPD
jgi:hypothetical protein